MTREVAFSDTLPQPLRWKTSSYLFLYSLL